MLDWWIDLDRRWKIRLFGLGLLLPQIFFYFFAGGYFPKLGLIALAVIFLSFVVPGDSSSTDI